MARPSTRRGFALGVSVALGLALLAAEAAPVAASSGNSALSAPTPNAIQFPMLEGAQAKVEIGVGAPMGPALTFVGGQNAWINFSVWFWDTGCPSISNLFVDGVQYSMTPAPGGDGNCSNGELYRAQVNATDLGSGNHTWYYAFTGPSGPVRLPATGSMGTLRQDRAELFLDEGLRIVANDTLAEGYRSGTLPTLRDVVEQATSILDPQMGSHWNGTEVPYDYIDENHNITGPSALAISGKEVFVGQNGIQGTGFGDGADFPNNSQPAHKQALALRGVLLATGLFNESDLQLWSDIIDVNGTGFYHPYLRVALLDGSELPGDGTADNDSLIDVDLWAMGLPFGVTFGRHFGDTDNNTADDVPWPQSVGWLPVNDSQARLVLWPIASTFSVTTPAGAGLTFSLLESTLRANATQPATFQTFWKDEPVVFDGLLTNQSMYLDVRFNWVVDVPGVAGTGPIWQWDVPVSMLGLYNVTLTVTDIHGNQHSIKYQFFIRAKTELRQAIPDGSFDEDSYLPFDLRGYFGDEDGFNTITFDIRTSPSQIFYIRTPPFAPNLTFNAAPDWCGSGTVNISATDGASPVVYAEFNLTVRCLNDPPTVTGMPSFVNMSEDGRYIIYNLSRAATDPDVGDVITWSINDGDISMTTDPVNDTMIFTPTSPNWFGAAGVVLTATDGQAVEYWLITFTVYPVNDAPIQKGPISAFTIQEDTANETFSLDAYFWDPDDANFSAEITADPGLIAGYFPPLRIVWFHPVANYSGPTGFTMRVRDASNASVTVHVDVQVMAVNDAPFIIDYEPKGPVTGTEGDLIIFVVQVIDSDSPVLTYTFKIDGQPYSSGTAATFDWATDFHSAGFHTVEVVVGDSAGGNDTHVWQVQIDNANRAPMVTIVNVGPASYQAGETINLTANGFDPDDEALTYSWNFGGLLQPMSGQNISFNLTSAGNHTVKVTVSDGLATASASIVITVVYEVCVPPDPLCTPPPPPPTCEDTDTCQTPFLAGPEAAVPFALAGVAAALLMRRWRGARRRD